MCIWYIICVHILLTLGYFNLNIESWTYPTPKFKGGPIVNKFNGGWCVCVCVGGGGILWLILHNDYKIGLIFFKKFSI